MLKYFRNGFFGTRLKVVLLVGLVFILIGISWSLRETILTSIGRLLVSTDQMVDADLVVPLRGDYSYRRTVEAGRLLISGKAQWCYLPKELTDRYVTYLIEEGVRIPSEQLRNREVLRQIGVGNDRVILGTRPPGGGTEGEALRVAGIMRDRQFRSAVVVTNWWHTRRTRQIYSSLKQFPDLEFQVAAVQEDLSSPENWWRYRYISMAVLLEFPKLIIHGFKLDPVFSFADDPCQN